MKTQFEMETMITDLSEQELQEFMYVLCRSGRVILMNYLTKQNFSELLGFEITEQEMIQVQLYIERYPDDFDIEALSEFIKSERILVDKLSKQLFDSFQGIIRNN